MANTENRHAISHPDLLVLQPGGQRLPNIPGLTGAGSSSSLSSLLASYASSMPNIPQVEYQDLGLTLKATPRVLRNDEVALTIDLKIDALAGTSINGNPVLNNRAYSGVVTLKQGEAAVVVSETGQVREPRCQRHAGNQRDSRPEQSDRQRHPEKLRDTADHALRPTWFAVPQAAGHSR